MTDPSEIAALKASLRGAGATAATLAALAARVDHLDPHTDPDDGLLDDLQRVSAAHALAAEAVRGLVRTMLGRRGKLPPEQAAAPAGGSEDDG